MLRRTESATCYSLGEASINRAVSTKTWLKAVSGTSFEKTGGLNEEAGSERENIIQA